MSTNYNKITNVAAAYEQFFLGLLEGDGSIQVNHWKKRSLQFRIVIKLKYTTANYIMCTKIRQKLNIMNLHIRHGYVIMVEDHRAKLTRIMNIIDNHGLLLAHRRRQYAFFKYCYNNQIRYSEYAHIKSLKLTWFEFQSINEYNSGELLQFYHWPNWLCGFTEAEGCFCIRLNKNHSFSIAQKDGFEVLSAIKKTFKIPNKIRMTKRLYFLETYAGPVLNDIITFYDCPNVLGLLGQKRVQYDAFKIQWQKKSKNLWTK
jgi:LAGLIDADG endonuclease